MILNGQINVYSQARKLLGGASLVERTWNHPLTAVRGIFDTGSAVSGFFHTMPTPSANLNLLRACREWSLRLDSVAGRGKRENLLRHVLVGWI
ncbi:MAG: hypothetical protein C5B44_01800 [Acidobacteria bacterium]|nr:MAG: hypothetical protein C5B44_01800 [Acidobacteriota bacterium]